MITTKYEQTKKYDVAGNVEMFGSQGIFSIEGVEESGIFALTENRYSKTYVLSDITFPKQLLIRNSSLSYVIAAGARTFKKSCLLSTIFL